MQVWKAIEDFANIENNNPLENGICQAPYSECFSSLSSGQALQMFQQ